MTIYNYAYGNRAYGFINVFPSLTQNNAALYLTTEVSSTKYLWFGWHVRIFNMQVLNKKLGPIFRETMIYLVTQIYWVISMIHTLWKKENM